MLQVYTGDGKGKTTAAIGLAVRSLGAGHSVFIMQFMKSLAYSEQKVLMRFPEQLVIKTSGKPCFIVPEGTLSDKELNKWGNDVVVFPYGKPPVDYANMIIASFAETIDAVLSKEYDLLILDELNMAMYFGLINESLVQDGLAKLTTKTKTEVVITGRKAPDWLLEMADLVTEMREIKHYYRKGIEARIGIEN